MNKQILGFLILVGLVGIAFAAYLQLQRQPTTPAAPALSPLTQPPANAAMIDPTISPVGVSTDPAFVGMWVPHPQGWPVTATKITLEKEGAAIRSWLPASTAATGIWVVTYVEGIDSLTQLPFVEGAQIRVGGQVKTIDKVSEGPIAPPRIVLRPGYVYK